ncbi:MAG: hypothetical protein U5L45_03895 [Saprospiraceae bacterium]|nr:hypothetical protein [Saprospiraceae bacterium]
MELGILYTVLKTNSGNFFQVKGLSNYNANYGGIDYNLTYLGLEAPINLYYQIYKKKKVAFELNTGVSFNLMGQFSIEHHIIEKVSGIKYKSGSYLRISDPRLDVYLTKFDEKRHQRLGFWLGGKVNYQVTKYLNVSTSPILKYYSNALEKSYSVDALRADAFLLGLQSQININF